MSSTIERIGSFVTELKFEDIPDRVVAKAKLQFLSMLAAMCAGFPTRAARVVREIILSTRASGRATVFPLGDRTSPTTAVVANAAASMAQDFDDYLFLGHTGHSAVLASLALAEERGLSGRELLCAQVIANEVGGRLGASVVLGPQNGQLWTHLHAPAAASSGARLLGLDALASAQAISISLYQPPFALWPGFMGPDSKLLSAAYPARDGILAAKLASWGFTGPLDVLDSDLGFGSHFAHQFLPRMISGFGESWVTDTLSYKIYPGCAYLDSALDALFELLSETDFQAAEVTRITVRTNLLSAEMNRLSSLQPGEAISPVRINFSLPHSLALGLLAQRLTPAEFAEEELQSKADQIRELADKVEVTHEWSQTIKMLERISEDLPLSDLLSEIDFKQLMSLGSEMGRQLGGMLNLNPRDLFQIGGFLLSHAPRLVLRSGDQEPFDLGKARLDRLCMPFSAELTVNLRDGQILTRAVEIPQGAAGRDFAETTGLVRRKFRDQATPLLSEEKVQRSLDLVDRLEEQENLSELVSNLCVG